MSLKRKDPLEESDAESSTYSKASSYGGDSDDDVDITHALSGKKTASGKDDLDDDFDELEKLIKHSVATRDKKEGTKLLKQTKKSKLTKGEVGGGSFQSMGESCSFRLCLPLDAELGQASIHRFSVR